MKTINHPNNLLKVQFPNGQIRYRSCQTSAVPDKINTDLREFPAIRDLRTRIAIQSDRYNSFKEKTDQIIHRNKVEITLLEILIGALAIILTILCIHL